MLDLRVKNLDILLEHKNRQLEEVMKFLELKSQKEKTEISEVTSEAIVKLYARSDRTHCH